MQNILTNNKILVGVLLAFVGSLATLDFVVFNEEAIVAFCFIVFMILFFDTIGDNVSSELDDKINQIQKQFDFSIGSERLNLLINYYPKLSTLYQKIVEIYLFSFYQKKQIILKVHLIMINSILTQLENKLKTLSAKQKATTKQIQSEIVLWLSKSITESYKAEVKTAQPTTNDYNILKESLSTNKN